MLALIRFGMITEVNNYSHLFTHLTLFCLFQINLAKCFKGKKDQLKIQEIVSPLNSPKSFLVFLNYSYKEI